MPLTQVLKRWCYSRKQASRLSPSAFPDCRAPLTTVAAIGVFRIHHRHNEQRISCPPLAEAQAKIILALVCCHQPHPLVIFMLSLSWRQYPNCTSQANSTHGASTSGIANTICTWSSTLSPCTLPVTSNRKCDLDPSRSSVAIDCLSP